MHTEVVWLFTRPGFETEGGREWRDRAAAQGIHGSIEPCPGAGWVRFHSAAGKGGMGTLRDRLPVGSLVFVRDAVFELQRLDPLPKRDRVGALIGALDTAAGVDRDGVWGELALHVPEGASDRDLANFARKWTAPLAAALRRRGWLTPERRRDLRRLELILPAFERLVIAESYPGHRAAHPGGRLRLRLSRGAPSRSTLKIEEAFLTLLSGEERRALLAPGMTAVDLGAAPGGWTFFLVNRRLFVTAVDNGPMDASLRRSGRLKHLRADGFTWLPDTPRDWMVCDIVDKPRRTVEMVGRWFRGKHCRASLFNLKLPMKRRLEEWVLCRQRLEEYLSAAGGSFDIRAKQLYHDREEITVVVLPA